MLAPILLPRERGGGRSECLERVPGPSRLPFPRRHERDPLRGEDAGKDVAVLEDSPIRSAVRRAPLHSGAFAAGHRDQIADIQKIEGGRVQVADRLEVVGRRESAGRVQELHVVAPLDRVVGPDVLDAGEDVRVREENSVLRHDPEGRRLPSHELDERRRRKEIGAPRVAVKAGALHPELRETDRGQRVRQR